MTYKRIVIAVPFARFLRWHDRLRESLARRWPDAQVAFRFAPGDDAQPGAVSQLLALERMVLRRGKPTLCDRIEKPLAQAALGEEADVLIDLTDETSSPSAPLVLRPLYDGRGADQAAVAAILSGAVPTIAVENVAAGARIVEGFPSFEAADGLTGGLEAVYSRISILIEKALADPGATVAVDAAPPRDPCRPAAYLARNVARQCARWLYHLCCHSPHWRVGWRFVAGADLLDSGRIDTPKWRVMQDREMGFAADPFPIEWEGRTGVFYERLDYRTNLGEIWFREFGLAGPIGEPVRCIAEKWHLSYPFLIEEDGALYMVPEASASGAITLYRCTRFPDMWEPMGNLVENIEAADATIFRHGQRFWMTSVTREGYGGYSDTLTIHHSPGLFGPWEPHARSPLLVDARHARPAGAVVRRNGALLRPAQECSTGYGKGLALMRIDRLDPECFEQSLVRTIYPEKMWPGGRLHTINRRGRLEVIDGTIFAPKFLPLRRIFTNLADSRASACAVETKPLPAPS